MTTPEIRRVFDAWAQVPELCEADPGVAAAAIAELETAIGRQLPADMRALYATVGGGELLQGDLRLYPPTASGDEPVEFSVAGATRALQEWGWCIPDDLVVFGDNGAGDLFGIWLPAAGGPSQPLIVEVAETFEENCLTPIGDDLVRFLVGWTALYLVVCRDEVDTRSAIAVIGLPADLQARADRGEDDDVDAVILWASPGLSALGPRRSMRDITPAQVADLSARWTDA